MHRANFINDITDMHSSPISLRMFRIALLLCGLIINVREMYKNIILVSYIIIIILILLILFYGLIINVQNMHYWSISFFFIKIYSLHKHP